MKNYPNQASSFDRIRATLDAIKTLKAQGLNVVDDGELGYALARRKIYTFRSFDYANGTAEALEARIATEKGKRGSNQGARTFARELRRTLIDLGWILDDGTLTPRGEELLDTDPGSDEERQMLASALLDLEIAEEESTDYSHPVIILLKLLQHAPTRHRAGLELILFFADDSEVDSDRALDMYDTLRNYDADKRAELLSISESVRANSVKVLPTLAKYAGLVIEDLAGNWTISADGLAALGVDSSAEAVAVDAPDVSPAPIEPDRRTSDVGRRRRLTRGRAKAADEVGMHALGRVVPRGLTPDQQAEAQARLQERTDSHQALVRYFAQLLDGGSFNEDTSSYDLAWIADTSDDVHLFEMKTISSDGDAQVVRAVGQLLYYAHFNVVARFETYPSTRTLIVDADLHADLGDFLDSIGIGALKATPESGLTALNQLGAVMLDVLPLKPAAA